MSSMISNDSRIRGMIWGQLTADAATLGAHWYYDLDELARLFPEGIQGFETPQSSSYHKGKTAGQFTHLGDGGLVVLESVAERGAFEAEHFGQLWFEKMAEGSGYQGYVDHANRETTANRLKWEEENPGQAFDFQQGANDDQTATITSLAPVVALYWHDLEALAAKVTEATKVRQNNPVAIAYVQAHAEILRRILGGSALREAALGTAEVFASKGGVEASVATMIEQAVAATDRGTTDAVAEFGLGCPLPGTFPGALQAALKHNGDFREAVLETTRAGGDSASRACMIGAWLGAEQGLEVVPQDWIAQVAARDAISSYVDRLLSVETAALEK